MVKRTYILIALLILVAGSLLYAKSIMQKAAKAYLYGYPIVLMDETRKSIQNGYSENNKRINQFTHIQVFPDHNFRNVVRPNVDTLYSTAWLDLSNEPVILSVPNMSNRYYVMPLMDAWTNVFATVGTRETGSQSGEYLIVGPDWTDKTTTSLPVIKSPSNMVWVIGRIQTNGLADISNVAKLQSGFYLQTLSASNNKQKPISYFQTKSKSSSSSDPNEIINKLSSTEFFNRLTTLIKSQGAPTEDKTALESLSAMGIDLVNKQNSFTTNSITGRLMDKAITIANKKIAERLADSSNYENGWRVRRNIIGRYGINYSIRTAVAKIGLGALPPEEAVYPNANIDSDNNALSGTNKYKIHFPVGQLPPVDAFWSLTMYDEKGFLIKSEINRYAIGDRDNLIFNADGSLDILIQYEKPEKLISNWLPTPKGEFAITLRMYLAKENFLSGQWKLPPVVRI